MTTNRMQFNRENLNFMTTQKTSRLLRFPLFLLWIAIVGSLIGREDPVGMVLAVVTIFTLILFSGDVLLLGGLIFFIFVIKGTFEPIFGILPRQAIWASDAIIVFLFLKSLRFGIGQKKFNKTPLFLPILLFLIWAVLSGFSKGTPWLTIGVALKDFFRYILLFYAIVNLDIEERHLKSLVTLFLVLVFMQIPLSLLQYRLYGQSDWVSGTLGRHGTGEMLVLVVGAISVIMGLFLYYKSGLVYLLGILCLLILPVLGSARAALFYIPVTMIFIIRKSLRGKSLTRTFGMLLVLGILVGFVFTMPFLRKPVNSLIADTVLGLETQVNAAVIGPEVPGRLRAVGIAIEWINRERLGPMIGYGFGSTKESYFGEYSGRFFATYSPRTNQLSSTLIEMGYPGPAFYFWLIFAAFAMNIRFFGNTKDNYWRGVSFGVDGIIFMHLVGIVYADIWRMSYSSFPFWFFLGVIYSMGNKYGIFKKAVPPVNLNQPNPERKQ